MFPRQFPSRWLDRTQEVYNDNRPYADSPLWLIDSLNMYIRETGDGSILAETVNTVRLLDPDHPETSGMVGCEKQLWIIDVIMEVFTCFERHVKESPYGLAQHMYGDWCDPIDMLGTSEVGNDKTRGMGRGSHVRLSAHLFLTLIETIDVIRVPEIARVLAVQDMHARIADLARLANTLRKNILKAGWEEAGNAFPPGFVNIRHELRLDGSRPDYEKGESGYTIGSMRGTDYDGIKRRELVTQAYCLEMILTEREYLEPVQAADSYIKKVLSTVDAMFYDKSLGLVLFTMPFANNRAGVELAGRIGVFPPGCGENGEYHHGQAMMHRYRLSVPGQADIVWKQFKPMMSVMRDESIAGPFETPCTSYVADKQDPHFGKAMYFGLSGTTDWIIEIFQKIAGLQLALHDPSQPDIRVTPRLPQEIKDTLTFKRIIHQALPGGRYRQIPFTLTIKRQAKGKKTLGTLVKINGKKAEKAEIRSLSKAVKTVNMEITYLYGK
jgi:cellobiose phosphorylase